METLKPKRKEDKEEVQAARRMLEGLRQEGQHAEETRSQAQNTLLGEPYPGPSIGGPAQQVLEAEE